MAMTKKEQGELESLRQENRELRMLLEAENGTSEEAILARGESPLYFELQGLGRRGQSLKRIISASRIALKKVGDQQFEMQISIGLQNGRGRSIMLSASGYPYMLAMMPQAGNAVEVRVLDE